MISVENVNKVDKEAQLLRKINGFGNSDEKLIALFIFKQVFSKSSSEISAMGICVLLKEHIY